jgi:outer membrane cobalamin receptor
MDDVTVVKGGDSVLYGTNAMGGAILMRSRWRDDDGWELGSDTSYGSFDTFGETLFVLGRAGPWDGAAAFRASRTDGHRDGAGGRILAFHAGGRHRFDNNWTLSLRSRTVNVAGADPGPVTHPTPDHYFDVWRESASLRLQWKHDRATVAITPYANLGWHRLYDGFASLDWTVGGTAEGVVMLHDTVELLVGLGAEAVDGRVQDRIAGTRSDMDGRVDLSFYNQLTWRPLEGLSLVLGSRELYSLEHGFVFLFKGGARWRFLDGAFVRTSISRNFRQPTLRERYLPFPAANPDLRPETSLNWDFGAGYDSRYVSVQVTGYRTQADDLIRYFGAWPSAEVVNIGSLVIWGVEGRLDLRSLGPVSAHVSGGWQDVGRFTRQNPSARVDFGIDVARDFGRHRAAGSLSGGWVHGLYMNNYGRDRIDDPVFLDLALRYRYRVRSANVGVEPYLLLRNLLDRRFAWIQSYPMPGFNVLAGLSIEVGR